jgi:hypothetical protein
LPLPSQHICCAGPQRPKSPPRRSAAAAPTCEVRGKKGEQRSKKKADPRSDGPGAVRRSWTSGLDVGSADKKLPFGLLKQMVQLAFAEKAPF